MALPLYNSISIKNYLDQVRMIKMNSRKFFFTAIFLILNYVLLETLCHGVLWRLRQAKPNALDVFPLTELPQKSRTIIQKMINDKVRYTRFSSLLGWEINEKAKWGLYASNSQGLRALRDYSLLPAAGKIRIAAFGDSFVHCDDVAFDDSWGEILARADPRYEVLNFGVGGYGLDQAFLRYRSAVRFRPHIVIIGYMSENINRNVNIFRPFYNRSTGLPLSKPRFRLAGDRLVLESNPLSSLEHYKKLLENEKSVLAKMAPLDFFSRKRRQGLSALHALPSMKLARVIRYEWFPPETEDAIYINGVYNTRSEAYALTCKIFESFYSDVLRNGSVPVIVIFPQESDIRAMQKGGRKSYEPLIQFFREKNFNYVDLMDAFQGMGKAYKMEQLFKPHYTPLSNRLVANHLDGYLNSQRFYQSPQLASPAR